MNDTVNLLTSRKASDRAAFFLFNLFTWQVMRNDMKIRTGGGNIMNLGMLMTPLTCLTISPVREEFYTGWIQQAKRLVKTS